MTIFVGGHEIPFAGEPTAGLVLEPEGASTMERWYARWMARELGEGGRTTWGPLQEGRARLLRLHGGEELLKIDLVAPSTEVDLRID